MNFPIVLVTLAVLCLSVDAFSPRPQHFKAQYLKEWQDRQAGRSKYQDNPEPLLKNIRPITTEGVNAEAYWSFDGLEHIFLFQNILIFVCRTKFSFQAIRGQVGQAHPCDQIYTMSANGTNVDNLFNFFQFF